MGVSLPKVHKPESATVIRRFKPSASSARPMLWRYGEERSDRLAHGLKYK